MLGLAMWLYTRIDRQTDCWISSASVSLVPTDLLIFPVQQVDPLLLTHHRPSDSVKGREIESWNNGGIKVSKALPSPAHYLFLLLCVPLYFSLLTSSLSRRGKALQKVRVRPEQEMFVLGLVRAVVALERPGRAFCGIRDTACFGGIGIQRHNRSSQPSWGARPWAGGQSAERGPRPAQHQPSAGWETVVVVKEQLFVCVVSCCTCFCPSLTLSLFLSLSCSFYLSWSPLSQKACFKYHYIYTNKITTIVL